MTVAELIEHLELQDQDAEVMIHGDGQATVVRGSRGQCIISDDEEEE